MSKIESKENTNPDEIPDPITIQLQLKFWFKKPTELYIWDFYLLLWFRSRPTGLRNLWNKAKGLDPVVCFFESSSFV